MRARRKTERRDTPPNVSARLGAHVTLQAREGGQIVACFNRHSIGLGMLSAGTAERAQKLDAGLPLRSFAGGGKIAKEINLLVRRLARHGLLEYCLARPPTGAALVVIEPQTADYWPQAPRLRNDDVLALSRFAYLRRRGNAVVLESPRSGALFRICDPRIAAALALLSTPQTIKTFRKQDAFPGIELLALLVDSQILFKVNKGARQRSPACGGRRQTRALGFSRSGIPRAQHRWATCQPVGRDFSVCRCRISAASGAAALARKEDRSA